jgi:hypothetical protein
MRQLSGRLRSHECGRLALGSEHVTSRQSPRAVRMPDRVAEPDEATDHQLRPRTRSRAIGNTEFLKIAHGKRLEIEQSEQNEHLNARARGITMAKKKNSELNAKQRAFVDGLRHGKSMNEAAVDAGYMRGTQSLRLMVARRFPSLLRKLGRETTLKRAALACRKNFSVDEIAKVTGLSPKAIRARMYRLHLS